MNNIMEAMKTRRSIRKFLDKMVPEAQLEEIIQTGLYAASSRNRQATKIVSVTNSVICQQLRELNRKAWGKPEGIDPFYGAPVILVVLADRTFPNGVYDGSLVMGNLMLAAHALGVGSCWIHRAREVFDTAEGKQLLVQWGIEGDYEGIGHCALGYIDGVVPGNIPRKPNRVVYIK